MGEFEQIVLLAALRQGPGGYAAAVRREIDRRAGRRVSRGALYRTFDRLEAKGLLRWELEDDARARERGGQPLRRFSVTQEGVEALRQSRTVLLRLWDGIEETFDQP